MTLDLTKIDDLKPEHPKEDFRKEAFPKVLAALERGCKWRQIWEATSWPYDSEGSLQSSFYYWKRGQPKAK